MTSGCSPKHMNISVVNVSALCPSWSHLKGDLLYLENSQGPRIRFYSSIGLKPEVQFYLANNAFACLCCVEAELEILWAPKHLGEFNFFPITSNVTLRWIYLF